MRIKIHKIPKIIQNEFCQEVVQFSYIISNELEYPRSAAWNTGPSARLAPLAAKRSLRSLCYYNMNLWAIVQIPLLLQISRCKHPTPATNILLSLQTFHSPCKHPAIAATSRYCCTHPAIAANNRC